MPDTQSTELPVDHFNDITRELINRLMTELNAHPSIKIRTKPEWCEAPLIGIDLKPLVPFVAMFLRNRLQLIQPRQTDIFSDNPTTKVETFVSADQEPEQAPLAIVPEVPTVKEPEPEPEKPAGKVPSASEILTLMAEKTINLKQAAAHFGVDKEDLRKVITAPGSGITIVQGGYLNVATPG